MCTLRFGGSFSLPITFYLNPFGHPVSGLTHVSLSVSSKLGGGTMDLSYNN